MKTSRLFEVVGNAAGVAVLLLAWPPERDNYWLGWVAANAMSWLVAGVVTGVGMLLSTNVKANWPTLCVRTMWFMAVLLVSESLTPAFAYMKYMPAAAALAWFIVAKRSKSRRSEEIASKKAHD